MNIIRKNIEQLKKKILLLEKELEQGDLIRVSRVELVGTRSYYFVSSEQHKNALIVKFTQWLEHEVREFESQFL